MVCYCFTNTMSLCLILVRQELPTPGKSRWWSGEDHLPLIYHGRGGRSLGKWMESGWKVDGKWIEIIIGSFMIFFQFFDIFGGLAFNVSRIRLGQCCRSGHVRTVCCIVVGCNKTLCRWTWKRSSRLHLWTLLARHGHHSEGCHEGWSFGMS